MASTFKHDKTPSDMTNKEIDEYQKSGDKVMVDHLMKPRVQFDNPPLYYTIEIPGESGADEGNSEQRKVETPNRLNNK